MAKKLIIVESPTKAAIIGKFLGEDYKVESSYGHVRDLPRSRFGIDIEHNFTPEYIVPVKARKRVTELRKLAAKSRTIRLISSLPSPSLGLKSAATISRSAGDNDFTLVLLVNEQN